MPLLYEDESYKLIGACFEVYKEMGAGFLEPVYQECLGIELTMQDIPFLAQDRLSLKYKGKELEAVYRPDFICYGKIVIEIKAISSLDDAHRAQVHNYLKATGIRLGLLVNFGHHPKIQFERIIR